MFRFLYIYLLLLVLFQTSFFSQKESEINWPQAFNFIDRYIFRFFLLMFFFFTNLGSHRWLWSFLMGIHNSVKTIFVIVGLSERDCCFFHHLYFIAESRGTSFLIGIYGTTWSDGWLSIRLSFFNLLGILDCFCKFGNWLKQLYV